MLTGVAYALYLFCNFSGYTNIVIGAARLYRLRLPENFDYLFSATSFIDLWSPLAHHPVQLAEDVRLHAFFLSRYTRTVWVTAMATIAVAALLVLASPAPAVVYKTF